MRYAQNRGKKGYFLHIYKHMFTFGMEKRYNKVCVNLYLCMIGRDIVIIQDGFFIVNMKVLNNYET